LSTMSGRDVSGWLTAPLPASNSTVNVFMVVHSRGFSSY
jgi:hypothetical protein